MNAGILESVRHEHPRSTIERVDDHLLIDGSGDLHTTIEQIPRQRRNVPFGHADIAGLWQEVRPLACVQSLETRGSVTQQIFSPRPELTLQNGHKFKCPPA